MQGNIGRGTEDFTFQALLWEFRKKYYIAEPTNDEYWEQMIAEGQVIIDTFKNTNISQYVFDVVMACIHDIDRRGKKK